MAGAARESRLAIVIDTRDAEARVERLRRALGGLGGAASDTSRGTNDLSRNTDRLSRSAASSNTAIQRLTSSVGGLQSVFGGLIAAMSIGSIFTTADAMQSLNSRIKLVTDSSEEYLTVQGRLRDMAQSNLTQYDSLVTLYASSRRALAQLGKTQNETLAFTDNLTKAMFIGGGAAASQAAALVQLGQALNSGALRGEEFNSIAEQAPILLELVAEKMGVAQGSLRKLAADGKISSQILYDAISDATEKLTGLAARMPATMAQGLETVKNQYKYFIDDMLNSTGGFSSVVANSLISVGQNLNSLIPILAAGGLAWGAYALATSTAVTTSVAAAVTGMASMGYAFLSNTALMKAQILSYFELNAMIARYSTNMMIARLTLANYIDIAKTAALTVQAKATAFANATKAAAINAGAIIRAGQVTTTLAASARAAAAAIAAKVMAMRSGVTVGSAYAATLSAVAGTAAVAATAVKGLTGAVAKLGGIINAHPIMFLAVTLLSVVAATEDAEGKTRGLSGAMDSLSEAVKVVGSLFLDFVKFTIDGISSIGQVFGTFITSFVQNSEGGANESSNMFAVFFSNTEGGFVGLLQVWARFSDLAAASTRNLIKSVVRGMSNLTKDVANKAGAMGNVLVDAFEWAAGGIAKSLNFISGGVGWAVKQLNKISPIQIAVEERNYVAPKLDRFIADRKLDIQDWSESMMPIMEDQMVNGLSGVVQRAIDSTRLAAQEAKADLDLVADGIANIADADDKAKKKKKAKEKKEKKPKTVKDKAAEEYAKLLESYEQQLAAFDRERYDSMASFNTELRKISYEVDEIDGKFFALPDSLKNNLKAAAQALDEQKILATVRDTLNGFERQLELIGKDSNFEQWSYDLNDASNILSTMDDSLKSIVLEQANLLDKAKLTHEANESIKESVKGINKEIALMGNNSAFVEFMYDLNETDTYAHAAAQSVTELAEAYAKLDAVKAASAFGDLRKDQTGLGDSEAGNIAAEYQSKLDTIRDYEATHVELLENSVEARLEVERAYNEARATMMIDSGELIFGSMASMAKDALGEQSGIYKAMFAVEKGFAIARSIMSIQTALASATASLPFPANLPVIAQVAAQGASIIGNLKAVSGAGFKNGGYTGNMGVNQVAGAVHGQEYVFDAAATKRIGVDNLNAMRSGKAANDDSKVSINIVNNSSAQVTASDDGQTITITDVRNEVKRGFTNLQNPNSYESKQINRNVQAPRRR